MIRLRLALRYFLRHKMTRDDKRNFRLGGIVSLYGISFAVEKMLIVLGKPLSDEVWFLTYLGLSLLSVWLWFEDSVLDLWEKHTEEDDELDRIEREMQERRKRRNVNHKTKL